MRGQVDCVLRSDKPFTRLAVMSPWWLISLALTAPSLTLTVVMRIFASGCFALLWHPVFRNPTRICKACFVVAIYDHHSIYMEYDGLLFGQGVRAKSSKQPQRWICYETNEKSHGRYCTLLYGKRGHGEWSALAARLVGSRSFVEKGKRYKVVGAMNRLQPPAPCGQQKEVLKVKAYLPSNICCSFWH
jgi:hypothetical protein